MLVFRQEDMRQWEILTDQPLAAGLGKSRQVKASRRQREILADQHSELAKRIKGQVPIIWAPVPLSSWRALNDQVTGLSGFPVAAYLPRLADLPRLA